jgi:hypothetical protein
MKSKLSMLPLINFAKKGLNMFGPIPIGADLHDIGSIIRVDENSFAGVR